VRQPATISFSSPFTTFNQKNRLQEGISGISSRGAIDGTDSDCQSTPHTMIHRLVLFLLVCWLLSPSKPDFVVSTTTGKLVGVYDAELGITAYKGVPFAADTSGKNRFKPPVAVTPWSGTLKAFHYGPACVQEDLQFAPLQSEDCLSLNVFVPRPRNGTTGPLPIMFWIFGGSFSIGDASNVVNDPSYFASSQSVIVVTSNYRLGPLGFFALSALKDKIVSEAKFDGNMGLLDQQCALKWIIANGASFGGSIEHLTLWGQSAGAMSVGLHVMTEMNSSIHSIIMESNPWGIPLRTIKQQDPVSHLFLEEIACHGLESEWLESCLSNVSLGLIRKGWNKCSNAVIGNAFENWRDVVGAAIVFGPVVDGSFFPSSTPFPTSLLGYFLNPLNALPHRILLGSNANEGATFVYSMISEIVKDWEYPVILGVLMGKDALAVAKDYPLPDNVSDPDTVRQVLSSLATEWLFQCPTQYVGASVATQSVFLYEFAQKPTFYLEPLPSICANVTCHSEELPYVWNQTEAYHFNSEEAALSLEMMKAWGTFAWGGEPWFVLEANDTIHYQELNSDPPSHRGTWSEGRQQRCLHWLERNFELPNH
jgi:carboxylesterase type B